MNEIDLKHLPEAKAVLNENGFVDFPTPWIGLTAQRVHEHGHWADYSAWESWMDAEMTNDCNFPVDGKECGTCMHCAAYKLWNESESHVRAFLYAIMTGMCLQVSKAMGWKDAAPTADSTKESK